MTDKKVPIKTMSYGIGLDIGTMNLVSARKTETGIVTKRMRDTFLDLPVDAKKMLKLSEVDYVERADDVLILGDAALETANIFGREARRPLVSGLISPNEIDSLEVLGLLVRHVLGKPVVENEYCYFSVPAAPIDQPDRDVVYHQGVFEKIVRECGYTPVAGNEAMSIIYSETASDGFSGIAFSFGSGMTNVALAVNTIEGLSFSVARCLSGNFIVSTTRGPCCIRDIKTGDEVISAQGEAVKVLEIINNGYRNKATKILLEGLPAFDYTMTPDHRVLVKQGLSWDWKEAAQLVSGDIVGTPVVKPIKNVQNYYFGCQRSKKVEVAAARNLGRFLGLFLGDGSCGPYVNKPQFVSIAFNRQDSHLVKKYKLVIETLFNRRPQEQSIDNLTQLKLHMTPVARHMKENFYDRHGCKVCPLPLNKIGNTMALGIIEGLIDSDGSETKKTYEIYNTSLHIIVLAHHLLARFGIKHTIRRQAPRLGGINSKGVQIEGRKDAYTITVSGLVYKAILDALLATNDNSIEKILGGFPDFAEYKVRSVKEISFDSDVFDLVVDSDHRSFASIGMVVHNSGDWIDNGVAKSIGSTQARVCAIKEKGLDLNDPQGREQEAIAFYYKAMIGYALDQKRKRFPIEISEIRQAGDPMNAVANGLLIQAMQEGK
jgi:hypothetical protein